MIVKRKCLCCGDTYEVQDYIEQELCYRCNLDKYKQSVDTCKELAHQANELEKENTELKCECRRCVHTDCPCVLSDYGKDRNGICDHFKDVFDENAELKEVINHFNPCGEWNDDVHDCEFRHYAMEYGSKLTKAKEIMNIAIEGIKHWGIVGGTERPFEKQAEKLFNLFLDKAEQFISEVE